MSQNINFKKIVDDNKEVIIKTLQELLQIKSVYDETTITEAMPFGKGINDALEYMVNMAKNDGFEVIQDGGYAAGINYGEGEPIGVLCHLDVVPEGGNWTYPPYEGKIVDGKIYARGSGDDKGPTIASYYALKFIKDAGIKLKKKISLILGTDEETGWRGISHYAKQYGLPEVGFAPDCSFPLVYGEKGRMAIDLSLIDQNCCEVNNDILISLKGGERYNVVIDEAVACVKKDLSREFQAYLEANQLKGEAYMKNDVYEYTIFGVASHAMEPQKGINAGTHMCNFLKDYSSNRLVQYVAKYHHLDYYLKTLGLDYDDYEMGPITCNIGIMDLTKDHTRVTLDLRYPTRYDQPHFEKVLGEVTKENGVLITAFTHKTPHYVSPSDPLVEKLYQAYVKNTGDTENKPFTVGGGTYASTLKKGVAYGMSLPSEPDLAHQRDEHIYISTLLTGILIYIDAILALGEIDA